MYDSNSSAAMMATAVVIPASPVTVIATHSSSTYHTEDDCDTVQNSNLSLPFQLSSWRYNLEKWADADATGIA